MKSLLCMLFVVLLSDSLHGDILEQRVSPSVEEGSVFAGYQGLSGQLAVTYANYASSRSEIILVAISTGSEDKSDYGYVKLYSYDDSTGALSFLENIDVESGVPFDITFIDLPVGPFGSDHRCLVIPRFNRNYANIDIYDVESCTLYRDCWNDAASSEVYHVSDLGGGYYGINASNFITVNTFESDDKQFELYYRLPQENMFYGASSGYPAARAYETKLYDYNVAGILDTACITTVHNGGIRIWDPQTRSVLSRIGVGQWGGSGTAYYDDDDILVVDGELGDVHRAAVLNGADISTEDGNIASRLLFFSNHTMGFMIYDISIPEAPQYVWQWDNDIRLGSEVGQFDWHGAGCCDSIPPNNYEDQSLFPGCIFGIGLRAVQSTSSNTIHLFAAGGRSGLLAFDFSNFLSPFGLEDESNYRFVVIDEPIEYTTPDNSPFSSYDLRTLDTDEGTLVFTSWKENIDKEDVGYIGISVHRDGGSGISSGLSSGRTHSETRRFALQTISPNPVRGSQRFVFSGCSQDVELKIFDSAGRLLMEQMIYPYDGIAEYIWDCTGPAGDRLQPGVYYLRAVSGNQNSTFKTIVLQ